MAKRIRQPRYAAGMVAGLAYFAWFGWMMLGPSEDGPDMAQAVGVLSFAAPLLLASLAAGWWMSGRMHMALAFTPPEVQFYFQAPIARRTLLHYKLAKAQVTLLPMALLMSLLFRVLVPLPWVFVLISLWGAMTVGHLHQIASGLLRASWAHQGRPALRRQGWPLAVLALATAGMLWALQPLAGAFRNAQEPIQILWALEGAMGHPAAAFILLPFHIAVGPLVAPDALAWLPAMAGLLALGVLHYLWLIRIDAAFEELAAEAGVELQAIQSAMREGRLGGLQTGKDRRVNRPWFRLRPLGHPAIAVFWKNFTAFTRSLTFGSVITIWTTFFGFWVILLFAAETPEEAALAAAALPGFLIPMAVVIGPLFLRNDLRTDFQRLELVRSWPISGRDLVAAEVAGSAASLLLTVTYFLVPAFVFLLLAKPDFPAWWWPWAGLGSAVLVLPLMCAISTGIQNILAVNFPAWLEFGPAQGQGLDQMGGMMVMMIITALLLAIAFLAPVVFGGVVGLRLYLVIGEAAVWPALLGVWLALAGEVLILVTLLGEAYEEMDPSAEGLLR